MEKGTAEEEGGPIQLVPMNRKGWKLAGEKCRVGIGRSLLNMNLSTVLLTRHTCVSAHVANRRSKLAQIIFSKSLFYYYLIYTNY